MSVALHISESIHHTMSFVVHNCEIIVSLDFFFVFWKFWFFKLLGRSKGKKWPKMTKNSVWHALYFRNYTSYDLHLWYTYVKGYYLQVFVIFFQILIFRVVSGVKGQKLAQNDKNFCLSHSISQEAYIIWSWFLVHMCKMMTSPYAFFIFQNFDFVGCKRAKNVSKWQKMICLTPYLRNHTS